MESIERACGLREAACGGLDQEIEEDKMQNALERRALISNAVAANAGRGRSQLNLTAGLQIRKHKAIADDSV